MKSLWEKLRLRIQSIAELLEKKRWMILAFIGISLILVEVKEFFVLREFDQPFHYFEILAYSALVISTGLLMELYARSNHAYKQTVKILEYKHRLGLEFTSTEDWESLICKLTELPGKIAEDVTEAYLLMGDQPNGKYEVVKHWVAEGQLPQSKTWDPAIPCARCLEEISDHQPAFHLCCNVDNTSSLHVYSLTISNPNLPPTMLRFELKPDAILSEYKEMIFNNIGDEIIVALITSQDRKRLSEMQYAEVAMAERRQVFSYVHDQLGQNLGYLHLKLDQLSANESVIRSNEIRRDLKHLQEVANESYEIVRDILKKMQPETIPHLTNLLKEHARMVSRRAGFSIDVKAMGKPIHLAPDTQKIIFFTFREILGNVEKHAQASRVDVLVAWHDDFLNISVADNGKGFDPQVIQMDEHFGLEIMHERISNIRGKLMVSSSAGSGTVVSISLPLGSIKTAAA